MREYLPGPALESISRLPDPRQDEPNGGRGRHWPHEAHAATELPGAGRAKRTAKPKGLSLNNRVIHLAASVRWYSSIRRGRRRVGC